jgi:hypothetical protein
MKLRFNLLTLSGALSVFFDGETRCIRFDSEGKSMALNGQAFDSLVSEGPDLFTVPSIDTDIGKVREFLRDISIGCQLVTVGDASSEYEDASAFTHMTPAQATLLLKLIRETMESEENEAK